MKKLFVLLVAVATLFAQNLFAQPTDGADQKPGVKEKREQLMQTRLELLKTELNLTDDIIYDLSVDSGYYLEEENEL